MKSGQRLVFWLAIGGAVLVALTLAIGIYLEEFRSSPPVDVADCEVKGSALLRDSAQTALRGRPMGWLPGEDRLDWALLDTRGLTFSTARWLDRGVTGEAQVVLSQPLICQAGRELCEGRLSPGKYEVKGAGFADGAGWLRMKTEAGERAVPLRWTESGVFLGSSLGWCGHALDSEARLTAARLIDGWSVFSADEVLARFRLESRGAFHPRQIPGVAAQGWGLGRSGLRELSCPQSGDGWSFDRVVARDGQIFVRTLGQGWNAGEGMRAWVWQNAGWRPSELRVPWKGAVASWELSRDGILLVETVDWWGRSPTARLAAREGADLRVLWEAPVTGRAAWAEVHGPSRAWIRWPQREFRWGRTTNAFLVRETKSGYRISSISLGAELAAEPETGILVRERAPGDYLALSVDREERVLATRIQCKQSGEN